jgi:hypothetical protein
VAHDIGQALCFYILPQSGRPIVCSTVQSLTQDERSSLPIKQAILALDHAIKDKPIETEATQQDIDEVTPKVLDSLISAEVLLPKGDVLLPAKVIARKRDAEGNLMGRENANPILDTTIYDVQFQDGHVESYSANIIAENIYAQVDEEGQRFVLLDEIMNHCKDNSAVSIDDKYIKHGSNQTLRKTTQGWYFQVLWRDGTTSWEPLKNLRVSNPVEVAEYVVSNKVMEEPAFAW